MTIKEKAERAAVGATLDGLLKYVDKNPKENLTRLLDIAEKLLGGTFPKKYLDATREAIKDGDTVLGKQTKVKVVKNKVAPPFVEAEFDILYNKGIWWEGSIIEAGIKQGLIVKRGSWLSYGTDQIGQGAAAAAAFLEQNPDVTEKLVETMKGNIGAEAAPDAKTEKPSK